MIPDFDPRSYPGPRPPGPVLVHAGTIHPLRVDGCARSPVSLVSFDPVAMGSPAMADPGGLRWSVAYGSNASPGRLVAKGLDRDGAVLLPARLHGFAPAFEHRRTGYASVPLTLVPAPGTIHDTWVLGLPAEETELLDRTEGRVRGAAPQKGAPQVDDRRFAPPGTYQLARVGEVALADRFVLASALAYLPGPATRVQVLEDGGWRTWPASDQDAAGAHVEAAGPDRAAPAIEEPTRGAWPVMALGDLPLFVYGTLRPDGDAFTEIAELVEVLGPASAVGVLYDTGRGWPAAVFDGVSGAGEVRGYVVAARDARRAQMLFDRADRYEGVPHLFVRTSVRVATPSGPRWAASYAWAGREEPGRPIDEGKWVVR